MTAEEETLLAVCRTTYRRVMNATRDVEMVQLALPQYLRRAGFEPRGDSPELTFGQPDTLVVLDDGRNVHRKADGTWHIDRDRGADRGRPDDELPT